jgi:propanol-preferring alcohol dehydrogenase
MGLKEEHTVNKAIQYSKPGTTETCIAELPTGEAGPGEVLVRM